MVEPDLPPGVKLLHTLLHSGALVYRMSWSPDGKKLAIPTEDGDIIVWSRESGARVYMKRWGGSVLQVVWAPNGQQLAAACHDTAVRIYDAETGNVRRTLTGHTSSVNAVAWSPDGTFLASGSLDRTLRVWLMARGRVRPLFVVGAETQSILAVAWSPDGRKIAEAGQDSDIRVWNAANGTRVALLHQHREAVTGIAWSPDSKTVASASWDRTVRLTDGETGRELKILEGHSDVVNWVAFSPDGRFLASKACDSTIQFWRVQTGERLSTLFVPASDSWAPGLAFHPREPILAAASNRDTAVSIWEIDFEALATREAPTRHRPAYFRTAKAVLMGDHGVGKSGLGLVLSGKPWAPTGSTHGRHVHMFDTREVARPDGGNELHETVLWDLAGQPDYRLIHQLHLGEVAVALVVFDARSHTDPFTGVRHWTRALRQAQRSKGAGFAVKKFLIAARSDVGSIPASRERIDRLMADEDFEAYFETSAKEGWGVEELAAAIRNAIVWEELPTVSSTDVFHRIKEFLLAEKKDGRLLSTVEDLYRSFTASKSAAPGDLRPEFETCIRLVESRGLIQRLSFGDLVLLQPELRDAYASAMINAAKAEPDGLGCIREDQVREAQFRMPAELRLDSKEQEKLLLISTVEELLRHEIALREQGEDGPYLVFPSQFTREDPNAPGPETIAIQMAFEGAVQNIYTTLVVRLSRSRVFRTSAMWLNSAAYTAAVGGICGVILREPAEGHGELGLFFDGLATEDTHFQFEDFIESHLQRRAVPGTVRRRRIFCCPRCRTSVTDVAVQRRRARGFDWIDCNVCGEARISLLDREERLPAHEARVNHMDRAADLARDEGAAAAVLEGKALTKDFDVFLCYNSADRSPVINIADRLKKRGLLPWLDEWQLRPGLPWQRILEQQIGQIKSAAVFVGRDGVGPWQRHEIDAFLREFADRGCPVIPTLLDGSDAPQLPTFLRGMTWVDFRRTDPDPMQRLIWGITGSPQGPSA